MGDSYEYHIDRGPAQSCHNDPQFAGRIGAQGQSQAALDILILNLEYFPESAMTHFSLSDAYVAAGRKELAIESLEKAIELMPGTPFLERKLQQLKGE